MVQSTVDLYQATERNVSKAVTFVAEDAILQGFMRQHSN